VTSIGAGLRGPAGLVATTVASGLTHVSALAFDDDGNLWAATAAFEDQGTDGVYLVRDGVSAPVEVLAGVPTPMGLVWHEGLLYVASAGGVDVYGGFDGTAFTTHGTVVVVIEGTGLVGGLALGPDGRFVLGISAPCDACSPTEAWSASVLSFAPDGSDVRVVAAGIRAPVGLVYFPGTSALFVTMNQRDDLGDETPGDWLSVVGSDEDWGFPDCYGQDSDACRDVPEPVAELDRHAAASGVAIVTGELGPGVGTVAAVAEWTKGKVVLVGIERDAQARSGYRGTTRWAITGFANPVAVTVTPDGALLVGDWSTGTVVRIAAA
jgi:glucose/arabinose dehydrogenase